MLSIFKRKKKIVALIILSTLILVILSFLWIIFIIPSFNIIYIRYTFAYKSEVSQIATEEMNNRFPNEAMPPPSVEVEIVYEYSPTCIVTLVVLHRQANNGRQRQVLVFERNEFNNWEHTEGYDITFESENGILPTRPSHMNCSYDNLNSG